MDPIAALPVAGVRGGVLDPSRQASGFTRRAPPEELLRDPPASRTLPLGGGLLRSASPPAVRWLAVVGLLGCGGPEQVDPCTIAPGRPADIADVLELIGRLPQPITLSCVLASLERPLQIEATADVFSAQPAVGSRSPRMFLHWGSPPLVLTVVPEGPGRDLLEFGQVNEDGLSIKGELHFPLEEAPGPMAPFERVARPEGGTSCGLCHGSEVEVDAGVYASRPLRPVPREAVSIDALALDAASCVGTAERCELLGAIFGHGVVEHAPLPEAWPTIYDTGL